MPCMTQQPRLLQSLTQMLPGSTCIHTLSLGMNTERHNDTLHWHQSKRLMQLSMTQCGQPRSRRLSHLSCMFQKEAGHVRTSNTFQTLPDSRNTHVCFLGTVVQHHTRSLEHGSHISKHLNSPQCTNYQHEVKHRRLWLCCVPPSPLPRACVAKAACCSVLGFGLRLHVIATAATSCLRWELQCHSRHGNSYRL